jgi:hypothetical protein
VAQIVSTAVTPAAVKSVRRQKRNGYLGPEQGGYTSLAVIANTMYGFRWYQPDRMPVNKITFYVQVISTGNDPFDFTIFNQAGTAEVMTRITAKTGLLNGSAGVRTLVAGTDYTAFTLQGDTVYNIVYASPNTGSLVLWAKTLGAGLAATMLGTAVGDIETFSKTTSYPIPADLSGITGASGAAAVPLIGLRET